MDARSKRRIKRNSDYRSDCCNLIDSSVENTKKIETQSKPGKKATITKQTSKAIKNTIKLGKSDSVVGNKSNVAKENGKLKQKTIEETLLQLKLNSKTLSTKETTQKSKTENKELPNKLKSINVPSKLVSKCTTPVRVVLKRLNLTTPTLNLRKRKTKNYAESSVELTPIEKVNKTDISKHKVPIYKQVIEDKKQVNKKNNNNDLYQFDESDLGELGKKKKRKRRILHDSNLDEYNKTIENILKNVLIKVKKRKNLMPNNEVNVGKSKNNGVIRSKTIGNKKCRRPIENRSLRPKKLVKITKEVSPKVDDDNCSVGNENQNDLNDNYNDADANIDDHDVLPYRTPINIISNILFSDQDIFLNKTPRPNANSTMLSSPISPWRFNNINIKRNPYFIDIKNSALPSISQEPVLDHTVVDKLDSSTNIHKTPQPEANIEVDVTPTETTKQSVNHKSTTQLLLTDFCESNIENKENWKTPQHSSLFDAEKLSPIKKSITKRKALGNLDNIVNSTPQLHELQLFSSPRKTPRHDNINDDLTYFGFESMNESVNVDREAKEQENAPYRFPISIMDKTYKRTKKPKTPVVVIQSAVEEPAELEKELSDSEVSNEDTDLEEEEDGGAALFEDFHEKHTDLANIKKRKVKWLQNDDKPRKRRKDMRTKEEEAEAERWAKQFNSMCKEVDNFPLEIE